MTELQNELHSRMTELENMAHGLTAPENKLLAMLKLENALHGITEPENTLQATTALENALHWRKEPENSLKTSKAPAKSALHEQTTAPGTP